MFSGTYLTTILQDGEKILHHIHVAKIYRTLLLIINIIIQTIYLFLVAIIILSSAPSKILLFVIFSLIALPILYYYLAAIFTEYLITDKRVMVKKGIISRNVKEMNLNSVETVTVDEGIIDRILKVGTIRVTGRGSEDICFKDIDEPVIVRQKVETNL